MNSKILGGLISALISASVAVGGCLQDGGTLLQSLDCNALPTIDKYYQPKTFVFENGTDNYQINILAVNRGNELSFWKIINPAAPTSIPGTNFRMWHQGDSDHDLTSYSICNGCRFGVASYKRAIVVFDMGTGLQPSIGNKYSKYVSTNPRLAYTYKNGDEQYIISKDLPGVAYNKVGIFRIVDHNNVVKVHDFTIPPGGMVLPVSGGFDFYDDIMLNIGGTFFMYRKSGDNLLFLHSVGVKANMGFMDCAAVYDNRMVTGQSLTSENGLKLWDISNPEVPHLLFTYPGKYLAVGFNGRHVITSLNTGAIKTFSVEGDILAPMDWGFWDPGNPWNDWPDECTTFLGGTFNNTGDWGYITRYSVFQKINFTNCGGTQPTPTPTPPPWPTPFPTCVPGCIQTGL